MQWTWGVFFCLKAVISLCSKQIHIYSCFIVYRFPTFLKTIGKKYTWGRKPSGQKFLKGVRRTYALKWGHSSEQFLTCYEYFRIISIAWKKLYFHWYFLLPQFSNFKQVNYSKAILNFWCRMPTYTLSNSQGITEDWKIGSEVKIPSGEMVRNEYLWMKSCRTITVITWNKQGCSRITLKNPNYCQKHWFCSSIFCI